MKQLDESTLLALDRQNIFPASATTLSSNNATGTESLFSNSAGTSSINVRGPGSLAGKVILNLGRITLRGVEKIIINRKLYVIGQSRFEARSPEIYKDVLELSRQGMYSDTIHFEAMRFLVKRIASGQTEHLVDALRKWYSVEVRLLLSELIACFDAAIQSPSGPIDPIIQAYKLGLSASITADKDHSFIPFINFLRSLVSVTPSPFSPSSIVFEAGLLDFLLHLYATGFRDPLAPIADGMDYHHKPALSIACNSLLIAIYQNDHRGAMAGHVQIHPIHALWPRHPALPPFFHDCRGKNLETQRMLLRRESWRRVEKRWVCWRISSIHDAMADFLRRFEDGILRDEFMDLVQFAGSDLFNDEQLAFRALRSLHQLLHHGLHWPDTEVYFRYRDALIYATEVFPRIVQRLSALVERIHFIPTFSSALIPRRFVKLS
ncbi:hypothetical protein VKT23_016004 [Stygiomarasmius scandens]|uniref:Uncharacterized protein n=1 Tax=Marasmiellus scandens TaxID=2682957 RepID=A0ABR1IWE3_9AGAR